MPVFPWIAILVFLLLIAVIVIAYYAYKVSKDEFEKTGKHPKGHYMGLGIALGIPLGIPIGLAVGNIALGPAIGVAIGIAIGTAWEQKHADELRPLTEREEKLRSKIMLFLAGFFMLGLVVFITIFK